MRIVGRMLRELAEDKRPGGRRAGKGMMSLKSTNLEDHLVGGTIDDNVLSRLSDKILEIAKTREPGHDTTLDDEDHHDPHIGNITEDPTLPPVIMLKIPARGQKNISHLGPRPRIQNAAHHLRMVFL